MDPGNRFCRCPDGAQLAYATLGDGPVLLVTPSSWDTIELRFKTGSDYFWESLASQFTVVTYDRRGTGLSDREREDYSSERDAADIATLGDELGVGRFDLLASLQLVPAAVRFAVDHPRRLRHLVLYGSFARGADLAVEETRASFTSMARTAEGLAFRMLVDIATPGVEQSLREEIVRVGRGAIDSETMARFLEALYAEDVSKLLPRVSVPTLVLHRQGDHAVHFNLGRELSAGLPDARFAALPGDMHWPWMGEIAPVLHALFRFLAPGAVLPAARDGELPGAPTAPVHRELRTVLFIDVESSTELTDQFGDEQARAVLRRHEELTRAALEQHRGTELKTMGDGFMASFSSVSEALEAAIAM